MNLDVDIWIITSISILSLIGCIFVIAAYYYFRDIQNFAFTLVKDYAIMNLLYSITGILPIDYEITCQISAYLLSISTLLIVQWTMVISRTLYIRIVKQRNIEEEKYRKWSIICVSCLSVLLSFLPFVTDFTTNPYGHREPLCWLKDSHYYWLWEILLFYGPILLAMVYNLIVSLSVYRSIKKDLTLLDSQSIGKKSLITRLFLYPFALFVCFFPCACIRIFDLLQQDFWEETLTVCSVTSPLVGFLNALIYGLTYSVRRALRKACRCRHLREIELDTSEEV